MTDLADIFAYDLSTTIHLAGSMAMLTLFAAIAGWMVSAPASPDGLELTAALGL
jgi:hypothetical protein